MSMSDNSFGNIRVIIPAANFESAEKAFINSNIQLNQIENEKGPAITNIWKSYYNCDWSWQFNRPSNSWKVLYLGVYNTPSTIDMVLETIAPFLIEGIITMFDNNCDDVDRAFIRFTVVNGIVKQRNAADYWPSY